MSTAGSESGSKPNLCTICLENLQYGEPKDPPAHIKPCNHAFHKTCIVMWGKQSCNVCPLCKGKFYSVTIEGEADIIIEEKKQVVAPDVAGDAQAALALQEWNNSREEESIISDEAEEVTNYSSADEAPRSYDDLDIVERYEHEHGISSFTPRHNFSLVSSSSGEEDSSVEAFATDESSSEHANSEDERESFAEREPNDYLLDDFVVSDSHEDSNSQSSSNEDNQPSIQLQRLRKQNAAITHSPSEIEFPLPINGDAAEARNRSYSGCIEQQPSACSTEDSVQFDSCTIRKRAHPDSHDLEEIRPPSAKRRKEGHYQRPRVSVHLPTKRLQHLSRTLFKLDVKRKKSKSCHLIKKYKRL